MMYVNEHLQRRAAEAASRMHKEGIQTLDIALFDHGGTPSQAKAIVSTSHADVRIVLGAVEVQGTIYYFGLPRG